MTFEEVHKKCIGVSIEARSAYDGKLLYKSGKKLKPELLPLEVVTIHSKIGIVGEGLAKPVMVIYIHDYKLRHNG